MKQGSRMLAACRFAFFLACLLAAQGQARVPQPLAVTEALNFYDGGNYSEFFTLLNRDGAVDRDLFKTFEHDANRWVDAPAQTRQRRQVVAASVALEIAHRLRDQPADRAAKYLLWASQLMRKNPPATPPTVERLWYLASVAGMEESDEPWALTAGANTGNSLLAPLSRAMGRGGQLTVAVQRFPDEPRFKLAQAEFSEWHLPAWSDFVPSFVEFSRGQATGAIHELRPDLAPWEPLMRDQAAALMHRYDEIVNIESEFEALRREESLRVEVELHIGHLEHLRMNWSAALGHLQSVATVTNDAYLRYLSQYFIGRTFHEMGNAASAVQAFERAVAIVPSARAASTHLAVELFLSDRAADRDRAYPLLQAAYADTALDDPWRLYLHGDAWLWPSYMTKLREALR